METDKELIETNGFLADSLVTRMEKVCASNTLRLLERNKPRTTGGISLHRLNHLITSAMETVTSDKVGFESTGGDAIDALIDEEMTSWTPSKGNDSSSSPPTHNDGVETSPCPTKTIKDETWQTLELWRHLSDKQAEFAGCSQEWVWESRRWPPLFLKKHEEVNKWCKDNYGLAEDGSVDKLAMQFPNTALHELRMFHALWVWAGFEEWSRLPLIVENFVRLLGETADVSGTVSDDTGIKTW